MKTNSAVVNWSNNIVFDGGVIILFLTVLKHECFFIRLNWFDCKKRIMQLLSI